MSEDDVRRRVAALTAAHGDDEAAHSEEDKLHQDVLRHYAEQENGELAREALKTLDLNFERWCA